jgi:hypothetical protein
MKKLLLLIILFNIQVYSQNNDYTKKAQSIDSTIETLYSVISGDKGVERDWNLFKYLFHKDAKLIPSRTNEEGKTGARFMSPDEYVDGSGKWLFENGFHEKEIGRTTERFGNIVHVFSSYESFRTKTDTKPFARGINSIQLLYDGDRWWILNVYWMAENNKNIIPKKYIY